MQHMLKTLVHPTLGSFEEHKLNSYTFNHKWDLQSSNYLTQYDILGMKFIAGAVYIDAVISALTNITAIQPIFVGNMSIIKPLIVQNEYDINFRLVLDIAHQAIFSSSINNEIEEHVSFDLSSRPPMMTSSFISTHDAFRRSIAKMDLQTNAMSFYDHLSENGIHYGNAYRTIYETGISLDAAKAKLTTCEDITGYFLHPTLIYGGFQVFTMLLAYLSLHHQKIMIPSGIESIMAFQPLLSNSVSVVIDIKEESGFPVSVNISWLNENDEICLRVNNFKFIHLDRSVLCKHLEAMSKDTINDKIRNRLINLLKIDKQDPKNESDLLDNVNHLSWVIIAWATGLFNDIKFS